MIIAATPDAWRRVRGKVEGASAAEKLLEAFACQICPVLRKSYLLYGQSYLLHGGIDRQNSLIPMGLGHGYCFPAKGGVFPNLKIRSAP